MTNSCDTRDGAYSNPVTRHESTKSLHTPSQASHDATVLLTADDLAARWQVPKSHVYRLTRERDLPAVKLGRYYRYRLSSIETWETAQEGGAPNAE